MHPNRERSVEEDPTAPLFHRAMHEDRSIDHHRVDKHDTADRGESHSMRHKD